MSPFLHVSSGRLYGGIERMLTVLAECGGQDFEFAVAADGRLLSELRDRRAQVHYLGDVRLRHPASVLRGRHRFRSVLRSRCFAAVVCHAPWSHALFGGVARACGIPTALWQHDRALGRSVVERACRAAGADLVICNSHWTAATAGVLQPGAPRTVIYCPVRIGPTRPEDRADMRARFDASPNDIVILAASRMEPWKGHLELVRALAHLRSRDVKLWIAGAAHRPHERDFEAAVSAEMRRLGLESRVRLVGEHRDVTALLAAADLLAQANTAPEPFGVIFAEALLAGVPVVTTNMGGAPEIVESTCGRLVSTGDLSALVQALDDLASNRDLRAQLGAAGPAHAAARCDPTIVIPQITHALSSAGLPSAA
jgi:glycosyltransferase involved in cell wall biosynthesis